MSSRVKLAKRRHYDTSFPRSLGYFPMQNWEKIRSRISSLVTVPMISSRLSLASCKSTATISGGRPRPMASRTSTRLALARSSAALWRTLVTTISGSSAESRKQSRKAAFNRSSP